MDDSRTPGVPHRQFAEVADLIAELTALRADMVHLAAHTLARVGELHSAYRASARNLLHYLALRRRDLRPLQLRLAALGLSSLGRAESHVLAAVDAILWALHDLADRPWTPPRHGEALLDFAEGQRLLAEHTDAFFGPASAERGVRIMVTMPAEAAEDYTLVHDLLQQGMNCLRIECAYGDAGAWRRMIDHLRRAEATLGRSCRVGMDLCGPRLRTGPLEPGPAVIKVRPRRDVFGRVTAPARVWLTAQESSRRPPAAADACLPLPASWLARLRAGERLRFTDARGASRSLTVVEATDEGCWAETVQAAYFVPGTVLRRGKVGRGNHRQAVVGDLPPRASALELQQGDPLILMPGLKPGRPATRDSRGDILTPATISCTPPEVFEDLRTGERVWLDGGRIGGVIERVEGNRVHVRITHARPQGAKLRGDTRINLPDSNLRLSSLTAADLDNLRFVLRHADLVILPFVNSPRDVEQLREHMARLGTRRPAVVLKLETRCGLDNLPAMLLEAMKAPCCGVLMARNDLAVECGFERLAEVQEELLSICEAAHVPVIWATQAPDGRAREGRPSRAEITDAALGHRAECVLLDKGTHLVPAVQALDDLLRRLQAHQTKKNTILRELHPAHPSSHFENGRAVSAGPADEAAAS